MKRIGLLCFVVILVIVFCSCSGKTAQTNEEVQETNQSAYDERYIEAEELYFYDMIFEILQKQDTEKLNTPTYYRQTVKAFNKSDEPQSCLHSSGKSEVVLDQSVGYVFSHIACELNANPFSKFNTLKEKGLIVLRDAPSGVYEKKTQDGVIFDFSDGVLDSAGFYMEYNTPLFLGEKKDFSYTQAGCEEFVKTVGALERANLDACVYSSLPNNLQTKVYYSNKDDCYYSFIINLNGSQGYITALYMRSDDGKNITDVVAQLMEITFPYGGFSAGASISISGHTAYNNLGKIGFFMAIENALSGDCLFDEAVVLATGDHDKSFFIPSQYEGENYSVKFDGEYYKSNAEYFESSSYYDTFDKYTYSISLK